MKINAFIPARLESRRFPNKVLYKIKGLPLIEHVRRRVLLSKKISKAYVVTPNNSIKTLVEKNGGNAIITKKKHFSGLSRVTEVVPDLNFNYALIIQADEPLIDPLLLDKICERIISNKSQTMNVVSFLKKTDIQDLSVVKTYINLKNKIFNYSRNLPKELFNLINKKIFKSIGLYGFSRKFLIKYPLLGQSSYNEYCDIEQMKLIDNGYNLDYFLIKDSLQSVNYKKDLFNINYELNNSKKQFKIQKLYIG